MVSSFEWGHELPRLSGRRVDLRWLTRQDAPAILAIFGDPEGHEVLELATTPESCRS